MDKIISAREANQNFAKVLREVEEGKQFTVTRKGKPVARITASPSHGARTLTAEQRRALDRLIRSMRKGWKLNIGRVDRDALYDDA